MHTNSELFFTSFLAHFVQKAKVHALYVALMDHISASHAISIKPRVTDIVDAFGGCVRSIGQSATLQANQRMSQLERSGAKVYKFGFGQSPFSPPDVIARVIAENSSRHEYTNVQGLVELRMALCAHYEKDFNASYRPDFTIIGPGSKILLLAVLNSFVTADVYIATPAWVSYEAQARLVGLTVHRISTTFDSKWKVTSTLLENALRGRDRLRPAILILNSPGNPTGMMYTHGELNILARIARREQLLVLSDEIYAALAHDGYAPSIAQYYPEGTIVSTGLSKWCGAGGWRLGALLIPRDLGRRYMEAVVGFCSESFSCASAPIQLAARAAYERLYREGDILTDFMVLQRRILQRLSAAVSGILTAAGIKLHPAEGAFYLYLDFSPFRDQLRNKNILSSSSLCEYLLSYRRIALLPGSAFGAEESELTARLAFVNFDGDAALRGIDEVTASDGVSGDVSVRYFKELFAGVNYLADWCRELWAISGNSPFLFSPPPVL
jgi:aspartate aminotransferase